MREWDPKSIRVAGAPDTEPGGEGGRIPGWLKVALGVLVVAAVVALGVTLGLMVGSDDSPNAAPPTQIETFDSSGRTPNERLRSLLSHNRYVHPRDPRIRATCRLLAHPGVGAGAVERNNVHATAALRCRRRQNEATFYLLADHEQVDQWYEEPIATYSVTTIPCDPKARPVPIPGGLFRFSHQQGFCWRSPGGASITWRDQRRLIGVIWSTSGPNNGRLLSQWLALGVPG